MKQCLVALCELYEEYRRLEECFDMYEFVMGAVASELGNKAEYDLSDKISMKILKNSLLYRRMGVLYEEIYALLWNDVQREKNQHPVKRGVDIKKELQKCIMLCEMCGDTHQIPFLIDALENGVE